MKKIYWNNVLTGAALLALVIVVLKLIELLAGVESTTVKTILGIVEFAAYILIPIFTGRRYLVQRQVMGVPFGQGYIFSLLTALFAGIMAGILIAVSYYVIGVDAIAEGAVAKALVTAGKTPGTDQELVVRYTEMAVRNPFITILGSAGGAVCTGLFSSLIIGMHLKKNSF